MVGSYQTMTYNRHAVQSATKFKAKIVDIPFCDPESGFAILIASRIEDGKSIVLKGIIPNPVENAYITYQGHWEQDARRGTQYVKVESSEIDYEAGGTDSIYELLTSGYVPGVGPVTAKKIIKALVLAKCSRKNALRLKLCSTRFCCTPNTTLRWMTVSRMNTFRHWKTASL